MTLSCTRSRHNTRNDKSGHGRETKALNSFPATENPLRGITDQMPIHQLTRILSNTVAGNPESMDASAFLGTNQ